MLTARSVRRHLPVKVPANGKRENHIKNSKGKVITELIAEVQSDENVGKEYRNRHVNPRRVAG